MCWQLQMLHSPGTERMTLACVAGLASGGPGGGFERLHFMLSTALHVNDQQAELSPQFLKAFDAAMPFDTNPLYAVLHESCYSQGPATQWAAQRVRDEMFSKVFDAEVRAACGFALCTQKPALACISL